MARRAVAALAVVLLAAALVAIWYRGTYHVWPGQAAGSRVHWCGRDYENDQGPASAETLRQVKAVSTLPLRVAGDYPPLGRGSSCSRFRWQASPPRVPPRCS